MQANSSRLRERQTCMWRSSAPLLATYTCLCSLIQTNYAFRTDAPGLQPFEWRSETIVTSDLEAMQIRSVQEAANASGQQMSLLALSIVKDSRSWGANRGLLDFLEFAHQLDTADP
ncbi:TPA: hypothetical protein ACH3X2_006475 [Trebouxia sp. C0005]